VLIEDGVIVDVAAQIKAPDPEVIDATDRIFMPGLVDNHRHHERPGQLVLGVGAQDGLRANHDDFVWPVIWQAVRIACSSWSRRVT
jgi:cytosine/adenosine deaminase-related metal-dependent hydrolase